MKSRIFVTLFALPFFGVGLWMASSIVSNLHDAWRMQGWESVPARLISAGYETHSGDDSNTYEAYARYSYEYRGRTYVGERVSIAVETAESGEDALETLTANPDVDPWLPGDRTPVLLPTQYVLPDVPREGIVLNIASKRLFYFPAVAEGEPQTVLTYPIGIGRVGWETPVGATEVVSKAVDPHWYVPASVRREHAEMGNELPSVVPPGPDNPLGSRVLKLAMPGYLIHGTNQPYGVGMRVSHGCVRLYPENIELLYSLVETGEKVRIINEPYLLGRHHGQLYFEAHAPLEDDTVPAEERLQSLLESDTAAEALGEQDADHIRSVASLANGVPFLVGSHDAQEVLARASLVRNTVEADPNAPTLTEVRELMDEVMAEEPEEEEKDL